MPITSSASRGATLGNRIDNLGLGSTQNINNLETTKQPLIQEAALNTILKNNKIKSLQGGDRVSIANESDEVLRVNVDVSGVATESFALQLLQAYTPTNSLINLFNSSNEVESANYYNKAYIDDNIYTKTAIDENIFTKVQANAGTSR